ncbi:MAG: hypothetical protein MHPSP_003248, partial [Paramarteilia canceri]
RPYFVSSFNTLVCTLAKIHDVTPVVYLLDSEQADEIFTDNIGMTHKELKEKLQYAMNQHFDAVGIGYKNYLMMKDELKQMMLEHQISLLVYGIDQDGTKHREGIPLVCLDYKHFSIK